MEQITERERDEMLEALLADYSVLYRVDLKSSSCTLVRSTGDERLQDPEQVRTYDDLLRVYNIHLGPSGADQKQMMITTRTILRVRNSFSVTVPARDGKWCRVMFRVVERGLDGSPSALLVGVVKPGAGHYDLSSRPNGSRHQEELENINNSLRLALARESQLRGAVTADAAGIMEINVSKGLITSSTVKNARILSSLTNLQLPCPLEETCRKWSVRIENLQERSEFLEVMNPVRMTRMYIDDEPEKVLRYYVRDREGNPVCLRQTLILTQDPTTDEIRALNVLKDVTREARMKEENERRRALIECLSQEYVSVLLVNLDEDYFEVFRMDSTIAARVGFRTELRYSDAILDYADSSIYAHDADKFVSAMSIQNLRSVLQTQDILRCVYRVLTPGGPEYFRAKAARVSSTLPVREVMIGFASCEKEKREEIRQKSLMDNALEQAKQASKAKSAFLTNMSHDIRTPMNAIMGFANIARTHIDERARVEDSLNKILASGTRLLELINNILDMSKIESGRFDLKESLNDLTEILEEIRSDISPQVVQKQLHFTVSQKITHEQIFCDRVRINQMLFNLVTNSVKYTPEGGHVALEVTEKNSSTAGYSTYEFVVRDDGIGMSEEFQKRIFEPFERERNTTSSRVIGSGLGMSIVRTIVDLAEGTISVDSAPGEGTCFTIDVPLRVGAGSADDGQEKSGVTIAGEGELKFSGGKGSSSAYLFDREGHVRTVRRVDPETDIRGMRVLLAEDNELNREIAIELLGDEGVRVDWAADGEQAVKAVASHEPDTYRAVLMDIQMPRMNGYEATRQIRLLEDVRKREIPVIAMTANAFDEDRRKARDSDMDGYIAKPFDMAELAEVLRYFAEGED